MVAFMMSIICAGNFASIIRGEASAELLQSYDEERVHGADENIRTKLDLALHVARWCSGHGFSQCRSWSCG